VENYSNHKTVHSDILKVLKEKVSVQTYILKCKKKSKRNHANRPELKESSIGRSSDYRHTLGTRKKADTLENIWQLISFLGICQEK
jgi:hypothetical protein